MQTDVTSRNSRRCAWWSGRRPWILANAFAFCGAVFASTAWTQGTTSRVSVGPGGAEGNGYSGEAALSADGRLVAFESEADNLVADDTNARSDVFVHDRLTLTTTRVSVSSAGEQGNDGSYRPVLSADGRLVAFHSDASNLVSGDTNGVQDIFVYDRQTAITTRVSLGLVGAQGNNKSYEPAVSGDGSLVAFVSSATNLVGDDTNGRDDVFVHDRLTGATTRVSVGPGGVQSNSGCYAPALNGDGQFVVFDSPASNLVSGDTNSLSDVFVHDRATGATTRVSVGPAGVLANGASNKPSVSFDGRVVAFYSRASNLIAGDTNGVQDVFVHDRQTATTTRVSVGPGGLQSDAPSYSAALSANGQFVAFDSDATTLVTADTNGWQDVLVHDRLTGMTTRVSVGAAGVEANGGSYYPTISADGRFVGFESDASNLVIGQTNGLTDVFVHDRAGVKQSQDFTGDRRSDILWHHSSRGDVWLWSMYGATAAAKTYIRTVTDPDWEIRGIGDQTGDGMADIVWRHKTTGSIYLWRMDGSTLAAQTWVANVNLAYDIVGTGDYNGDGKSDLLWRNPTNGELWMWLMDGATRLAGTYVSTVDPVYTVVGSGDLDGDGKADVVWHHETLGEVWVWLMDGATPVSKQWVATVGDLGFEIAGVADYSGDLKADLLWRHATLGDVWLWRMDGGTRQAQTWIGRVPTNYHVVGTGDYSGDGRADILWHHATLGDVWVWVMDGATPLSKAWVATVKDLGYQVVVGK